MMRSDGNAIRRHGVFTPHLDLGAIRDWVRSRLTAERIAEAGMVAVLYKGIQGIQAYSITGF